jgi:hypothetical protein
MKTLNWRHTDWNARNFIFSIGQEIIGQLTFSSYWNFNAAYTDKDTNLKFSQKSFWDRDAIISKDGKTVGEINFGLFATQTLKLENGETIIKYQQATMSSMGKGLISLNDSLTIDKEKLLISGGLFARQVRHKRIVLFIAIMIPILAASRR